ncbi:MAG: peptide chain release factor N(5)-glutamine methyltransferase [Ktedonobacterales bacterium]|nr:peptide chain release factor N(5)-glutamine methyltransferase [Ktedonobacterales bacterium]
MAAARTNGDALRLAIAWLRAVPGALSPELDAQVLLAHVTAMPRARVLAYPEWRLAPARAHAYAMLLARRVAGEPVAYLIGHREFMGLDLLTDHRALIPRPETELLVEAALADLRERLARDTGRPPLVADIGTGTGAIAIAIAALEPRLPRLYAVDLSADALALAARNARHVGVADRVALLLGDLLEPLPERVDMLLANLPYVAPADARALPLDVRQYEPALALYGADDGLGHLRRFFASAPGYTRPDASILVEFGAGQAADTVALARAAFPGAQVRIGTDYAGWERCLIVRTSAHPREGVR